MFRLSPQSTQILLAVLIATLAAARPAPAADTAATPARRSLNNREAAIHVLNRLAFGPKPGQVDEVTRTGWKQWVEAQLHPETINDSAIAARLEAYPSLTMDLTQVQDEYQPQDKPDRSDPKDVKRFNQERNRLRADLRNELYESVLLRAVYSERQLQEVIVEFWRNHFNIELRKVEMLGNHYEENVLRAHAFGKFEDLLLATAKHPAMLVYLDNHVSRANSLNENYARELMELHTLGVDNYYKQKDVIELARILTGWSCGYGRAPGKDAGKGSREYQFTFNARNHDASPATVVGFTVDGKGGMADGEAVIRYLAHHEGTARFLCFKLCRYLLRDEPPSELVEQVTEVFRATDGDLREVYRAIIFSDHFIDPVNYRCKFKTPFEFTVSALRATDAQVREPRQVLRALSIMGQEIYECIEPTGYYDQTEAWLDPGVMVYRWDFAIRLVSGKVGGVKIPEATTAAWDRAPASLRARQIIDTLVPGANDRELHTKIAKLQETRGMIGLVLGSAAFQQQ